MCVELAGLQRAHQSHVVAMLEKALAQSPQRVLNTVAEPFAGGHALLSAFLTPTLQRTVG